jgi:hypothetical protein
MARRTAKTSMARATAKFMTSNDKGNPDTALHSTLGNQLISITVDARIDKIQRITKPPKRQYYQV